MNRFQSLILRLFNFDKIYENAGWYPPYPSVHENENGIRPCSRGPVEWNRDLKIVVDKLDGPIFRKEDVSKGAFNSMFYGATTARQIEGLPNYEMFQAKCQLAGIPFRLREEWGGIFLTFSPESLDTYDGDQIIMTAGTRADYYVAKNAA